MASRPFDPIAELQTAFKVLTKNWVLAVPTGVAALAATVFFVFMVAATIASIVGAGALAGFHPPAAAALAGVGGVTFLVGGIIIVLLIMLSHATVMGAAENVWHGQPADVGAGLAKALSKLPSLIGLFLVAIISGAVCLVLVIALGLGLVLALALGLFWMYALPAVIVGNQGALEALGTSFRLVRANIGPSLIAFVGIFVANIVGEIIIRLFHFVPPLVVVVAFIVGGLTYAYTAIVAVRFYDLLRGAAV